MSTVDTAAPPVAWRRAAALLAVGVFAVGTDAYVVAGLLPEISDTLHVSTGAAGQLVTVFAIAYALSAPVLGTLTARWERRKLLVAALLVFALGNVLTAVAPSYALVVAARVVAAAGAGLVTATSTASAAALAGEARRGRAIAIVIFGSTSSLVLGAPLGAAVGGFASWRTTMLGVAALGLLGAAAIRLRLPAVHIGAAASLRERLAPLRDPRIRAMLARSLVVFVGIFVPFTYLSKVYDPVTGGGGWKLAGLMSVFGAAGTAGNLVAGTFADRVGPRRVLIVASLALTVAFAVVPLLRDALAPALVAIVATGWLSFSITTPQQHELIAAAPGEQPLVTSLYQSVVYMGVSLSGAVGALGLSLLGAALLPLLGAALTLAAAALALAAR